jgi:putative selenate reductase
VNSHNDELHPLGFERLLDWITREQAATGTIFGLHQDLHLLDLRGRRFGTTRYGQRLEAPIGVAAGPHSQLSQNIVAAWLCGARFIELKTVQILDELTIDRPCIDMQDEGYNCEWSQELPIDVSFSEYADAWAAIRLLQHRAGACEKDDGFMFNMSVGYDLEGIRGEKVSRFLDAMADSRAALEQRLSQASAFHSGWGDIAVPDSLSNHVTLSTMHGCPPDEIERIGRYLLEERGLNVAIKLNPTLLGPERLRGLLNDTLGYGTEVPDDAFAHDMEFSAATDMVRSLTDTAQRAGVAFGVKLTNTLECRNVRDVFPETAPMMYMSGRALHPITVQVATMLQNKFDGSLDVSYSGGADFANTPDLLACGLGPVTVCSDLLRPGGYQRLRQYIDTLDDAMGDAGSLDEFAAQRAGQSENPELINLRAYAKTSAADPRYRKDAYHDRAIKTDRFLDAYDCVKAPCVETCPAGQDVPEYMHHTARGDFEQALSVVLRDNPFPAVTGMVCDHFCLDRCTRVNYDEVVGIRDVKRFLAHHADGAPPPAPVAPSGHSVALIGAGPASLTCAYALALSGVAAVVYETKGFAGGMITDAIPSFRLDDSDFANDLARIEAAGVEIRYGESIDSERFETLRSENDAVFVGVGAQADYKLDIPGENLPGVQPALAFLSDVLRNPDTSLSGEVAVIGAGNTAMDAARTAVRLLGDGSRVHIVYRRTVAEMPADIEELKAVRAEGVTIHELLAPETIERHGDRLNLNCRVMRLGDPDESGRRRPEPVGDQMETLTVDTVIPAIGQHLDCSFLPDADSSDDVFSGGDAQRGPASLIHAIADGRHAAEAILRSLGVEEFPTPDRATRTMSKPELQDRASRMALPHRPSLTFPKAKDDFGLVIGELDDQQVRDEAARCLDCSDVCDACVTVCPNRAFVGYDAAPKTINTVRLHRDGSMELDDDFVLAQGRQTALVADWCNQCGNCVTFCPTAGSPWLDKPRLAANRATFELDRDVYLIERSGDDVRISSRHDDREESLTRHQNLYQYETPEVRVMLETDSFAVQGYEFLDEATETIDLQHAAEMSVLLEALGDGPLACHIEDEEE